MLVETGKAFVDPSAMMTQMREDSDFWSLPPLTNTFGHHEASRRWTWHSPHGQHHNLIDCVLVKKRFRSEVNSARTQRFPGADTESDRDLMIMTFCIRLKRIRKPKQTRLKFDIKKLKDPKCVGNLPSHDRREVWTSQNLEKRRYRHGFDNHHLQHSSD